MTDLPLEDLAAGSEPSNSGALLYRTTIYAAIAQTTISQYDTSY
jgi:hypothetical protein